MRYCPQCQSKYPDDQAVCPLDAVALLTVTDNAAGVAVDPLLGRVIADKYRIIKVLGRGGMGSVYEGQHLLLDRTVAIKVLRGNIAADERAATRFIREAKAAAKIEHPNAVTIYDFGVLQDGNAYLVMEFIRGCSLRQILYQEKQIPTAQCVEWIAQVCGALEVAHQQGIIHRDLKPENIMLKSNPDGTITVKVVDFGLAKLVTGDGEDASSKHLTQTGEVMGTPHYMAPEFYDADLIDKRADIYAIGVILYEMLTGDTPFTGTMQSVIGGHLFKKPEPLLNRQAGISPALNEVVLAALHKQKDLRIGSAAELAQRLRQALAISQDQFFANSASATTSDNPVKNNATNNAINTADNKLISNNLDSNPLPTTTPSAAALASAAIIATPSPAPPTMPSPPVPIMERATPVVERSTVANPSNYPTVPITDRVPLPSATASTASTALPAATLPAAPNVRSTVIPITSQPTQPVTAAELAEISATRAPKTPATSTTPVASTMPATSTSAPNIVPAPVAVAPSAAPQLAADPVTTPIAVTPPLEGLWDVLVALQKELLIGALVAALLALILVAVVIYRDVAQQSVTSNNTSVTNKPTTNPAPDSSPTAP
jgi:serine/threonine protein kinase